MGGIVSNSGSKRKNTAGINPSGFVWQPPNKNRYLDAVLKSPHKRSGIQLGPK